MARVVDRDFEKAAQRISDALLVGYQQGFDYSALLFQLGENNHQQILSMINSPLLPKESLEKLPQYLDLLRFIAEFSQPNEPIEPLSQQLALLTEHVLIPPSLSTFLLSLSKQLQISSNGEQTKSTKTKIAEIRKNLSQLINAGQYTIYIATIDEVDQEVKRLLAENAALNEKYGLEDQYRIGELTYLAKLDGGYSFAIQSQVDRISRACDALQAFAITESTISNPQRRLAVQRKIKIHHRVLTKFKELSETLTDSLKILQRKTFVREDQDDVKQLEIISQAKQEFLRIIDSSNIDTSSTKFQLTQSHFAAVLVNNNVSIAT